MNRSLRAKLPNGMTVIITPYFEKEDQRKENLAAAADHLAEMLDSPATRETELLSFLGNVALAVFPEADPSSKPSVMHGTVEGGVDLTFDLKAAPGIGIVEIKTPRLDSERSLQVALFKIRDVIAGAAFGKPVHVVYLIAGRRHQITSATLERASAQRDRLRIGVPVVLLSWDQIVDRLSGGLDNADGPQLEVVLVEVVRLSRRLLQAILSRPAVLAGIDDRKFEELVATLLFDLGIQDVQLTPPRQDGGRDIIIVHMDPATGMLQTYLIECKHWVSGRKVTMRWALSLLHVAQRESAAGAVLLSSSGFGPRLLEQETTMMQEGLFLKDQRDLMEWIGVWERQYGSILMEPVDPKKILALNGVARTV